MGNDKARVSDVQKLEEENASLRIQLEQQCKQMIQMTDTIQKVHLARIHDALAEANSDTSGVQAGPSFTSDLEVTASNLDSQHLSVLKNSNLSHAEQAEQLRTIENNARKWAKKFLHKVKASATKAEAAAGIPSPATGQPPSPAHPAGPAQQKAGSLARRQSYDTGLPKATGEGVASAAAAQPSILSPTNPSPQRSSSTTGIPRYSSMRASRPGSGELLAHPRLRRSSGALDRQPSAPPMATDRHQLSDKDGESRQNGQTAGATLSDASVSRLSSMDAKAKKNSRFTYFNKLFKNK